MPSFHATFRLLVFTLLFLVFHPFLLFKFLFFFHSSTLWICHTSHLIFHFFPHNTYFYFFKFSYTFICLFNFLLYQVYPPYLSLNLSFSLFYISLPSTLFIFSFLILSRLSSTVFTLLSLTLSKISSFHFHPYLILPYSIHCHPCLSQTFHFPNLIFFLYFTSVFSIPII